MKTTPNKMSGDNRPAFTQSNVCRQFRHHSLALLAAGLTLLTGMSAFAQVTNFYNVTNVVAASPATVNSVNLESYTGDRARLAIPVNASNSAATEIRFNISGAVSFNNSTTNFIDPDYFVTNTYNFSPRYVTLTPAGFPTANGTAVVLGAGITAVTNSAAGNASFTNTVVLNYTNVSSGDYNAAVEVAGVSTWRYPIPVRAGYMWIGTGTNATSTNIFSVNLAAIAFNEPTNWVGGVPPGATSDIVILTNAGTSFYATNATIAIATDTTIGGVEDIHIGDNYTHWNIASGATLFVTGNAGYRQSIELVGNTSRARVRASGAGTMVVSNANADFITIQHANTANGDNTDFSALNTLVLDVRKIAINDVAATYPNYGTNGAGTLPTATIFDMDWALTNILRATHTDANGWSNNTREYGFTINRARQQTGNDGGNHFGLWNELYADSILFGGNSQMQNPRTDFRTTNSYLKIRNTDKTSRVSNITLGDAMDYLGVLGSSGATRGEASFVNGTLDVMANTLILGRNPLTTANGPANGLLIMGPGTVDVNTALLGYQTGAPTGTEQGHAFGRVELNSNSVFRVNSTMVLGYTETNLATVLTGGGQLLVNAFGSAQVNNITVGGPANASTVNSIDVNGGTLVVSNAVASLSAPVQTLTVRNGGVLSLPNLTTPGVTNVFAGAISGSAGVISLPGLTTSGTYIIAKYTTSASITWSLSLPGGFYGFLTIDPSQQLVKAIISTSPPKTCVWVGNVSPDWDTTTLNWKELISGNPTNFAQGDAVLFDDSASNATVNVAEAVIPAGGTTITNDTLAYSFSGSNIEGTAATTKTGSNTLTIANTHLPALTVSTNGSLVVSGTLSGGLTLRGVSAVNNGAINGAVALQNGSLLNNATITTTPGALNLSAGTFLTNSSSATIVNGSTSDLDWPVGTTVVNAGQINNTPRRITMRGVWINRGGVVTDTGTVSAGVGRLTMQGTSQLYIEDSNIGGMTVEARFDLIAGSRVYIDYDRAASPKSDYVSVDFFGDMLGTFVMQNLGVQPVLGDVFTVMQSNFAIALTNANAGHTALVSPKVVNVGLVFVASGTKVTTTNGGPSAVRNIVVGPVITSPPPTMASTNNGNGTLTFSWNANYLSYVLLTQTNALSVGLSNNWFTVPNSHLTNNYTVSIDTNNPSVFFRLSNTNAP